MFCVPPPFPPVTTRSVSGAGGLPALPRPPITRRAPFLLWLRCFARRRQKRRGGAADVSATDVGTPACDPAEHKI
ncbi:hypothetical protein D7X33_12625 [Butyricicoccus sp. 1XD8-22]|nr:hypothetical protein D7X33_12625 [Butyricicoccus sp. 1XD8-22]